MLKERFTKHFGYNENNFVEDNFSLKLIYSASYFCRKIWTNLRNSELGMGVP